MTDRPADRRRYVRITPKGTVVMRAGDHVQRCRIGNLGEGGMLAMTSVAAPERLLGRTVELELRFDGREAQWLLASGRITRLTADTVAIAFDEVSPTLRREIDEMSASSRAHKRVMNVVLVDADAERRGRMATAFGAVGCTVIEASTPLEAIVRLGEASFEPDLIAIADSLPSAVAEELRSFVDREHPRTKLVAIGNETVEPIGDAHWLSASNPAADLLSRVREMLGRPRRPVGN